MNRLTQLGEEQLARALKARGIAVAKPAPPSRHGDLTRYQCDPVGYAREVLSLTLTDAQEEMLCSVRDNRRTAVQASHGIGKTFLAGVAANWWYDCWPEHIVYITAPTWDQALGLTFKEVKVQRWSASLPGEILESGVVRDPDPRKRPAHYIRALNAENGEAFQGEPAAPILVILEEAVGVPGYIWEALDGLLTHPESRALAVGNPTDASSLFAAACQAPEWHPLRVSALDHPNILAEMASRPAPFPKAVRLTWLEEMLAKHCRPVDQLSGECFEFPADSGRFWQPNAVFQGRAKGEFPTLADEQVIPAAWLRALPQHRPEGVPEIGMDPARLGADRTVIAVRQGWCVLDVREVRQMTLDAVTGLYIDVAREAARRAGCGPREITGRIDVTGGLGAGPYDFLRAQGYHKVVAVNVTEAALDKQAFKNQRSELWFTMRAWVEERMIDFSRLSDEVRKELFAELSAPKYAVDYQGRRVVEPKADTHKRLKRSPDLADAVNLAFAARLGSGGPLVLFGGSGDSLYDDDDEW